MHSYTSSDASQRRCLAILDRFTYAFVGSLNLEDDHAVRIKAILSQDQERLSVDVWSLRNFYRAKTVLHRTLRLNDWESDFVGVLVFLGRRYQLGATLIHGHELQLKIFFRLLLRTTVMGAGVK